MKNYLKLAKKICVFEYGCRLYFEKTNHFTIGQNLFVDQLKDTGNNKHQNFFGRKWSNTIHSLQIEFHLSIQRAKNCFKFLERFFPLRDINQSYHFDLQIIELLVKNKIKLNWCRCHNMFKNDKHVFGRTTTVQCVSMTNYTVRKLKWFCWMIPTLEQSIN